jgi:hypothetical protein
MLVHLFENQGEWEVVAYYPYTSIVTLRIYESQNFGEERDDEGFYAQKLFEKYMQEAENLDCRRDNKAVIELKPKRMKRGKDYPFAKDSSIFIGRYDGKVSIGLGVYIPYDSCAEKYIQNVKVKDEEIGKYKLIHDNF